MRSVLVVLVVVLMLGTLGVLFAGLVGMVRGGGDPHRANALMRWRVLLQAGALLLFALLMGLLRS
jgi:NADH:ubiquinone oxidoreductase subunit 6 (subunit J)